MRSKSPASNFNSLAASTSSSSCFLTRASSSSLLLLNSSSNFFAVAPGALRRRLASSSVWLSICAESACTRCASFASKGSISVASSQPTPFFAIPPAQQYPPKAKSKSKGKELTLPLPNPLQNLFHLPRPHPVNLHPLLRALERLPNILLHQRLYTAPQRIFTALGRRVGR